MAAIVVVELFAQLNDSASTKGKNIGNAGGSPQQWSWKSCKRMEVDVVDERTNVIECEL